MTCRHHHTWSQFRGKWESIITSALCVTRTRWPRAMIGIFHLLWCRFRDEWESLTSLLSSARTWWHRTTEMMGTLHYIWRRLGDKRKLLTFLLSTVRVYLSRTRMAGQACEHPITSGLSGLAKETRISCSHASGEWRRYGFSGHVWVNPILSCFARCVCESYTSPSLTYCHCQGHGACIRGTRKSEAPPLSGCGVTRHGVAPRFAATPSPTIELLILYRNPHRLSQGSTNAGNHSETTEIATRPGAQTIVMSRGCTPSF